MRHDGGTSDAPATDTLRTTLYLNMPVLNIAPEYGWNILAASGIVFQLALFGGYVGAARKKYGVTYPDMGCGRYTAKLTDDQWLDFNNHQRVHQNYVEGAAGAISLQLMSGIFFPKATAAFGALYMIGRQVYAIGYIKKGSNGRLPGVLLFDVALLAKLGMSIYGALKLLEFF